MGEKIEVRSITRESLQILMEDAIPKSILEYINYEIWCAARAGKGKCEIIITEELKKDVPTFYDKIVELEDAIEVYYKRHGIDVSITAEYGDIESVVVISAYWNMVDINNPVYR